MDAFEDLEVWKRSCRLCVRLFQECRDNKNWGYKDQITCAALSIPSNIAEGYERNSRKEYVQFLRIAKGSCGEVRTQLFIGREACLLEKETADEMLRETAEIGRMLGALIARLTRAT